MTRVRAATQPRSYGRAAGLLTVALATGGLLTYGFFAVASHTLPPDQYGQIVVLWAAVFILVATLFRPVEQLLARTIAEVDARGGTRGRTLRVAGTIQAGFALAFAVVALALRESIEGDLLDGEELLFWVMLATVLGFSASFYLRGYLAGSRQFLIYGTLVVIEGGTRLAFALAAAIGIATGADLVALGLAAAPALSSVASLLAARGAARRVRLTATDPSTSSLERSTPDATSIADRDRAVRPPDVDEVRPASKDEITLAHGGGFAVAVLVIMLSEQVILNGGPLITRALEGSAAAGFIFNVLIVARAPFVLFQAIAASLLPHLTRLLSQRHPGNEDSFRSSIRLTVVVVLALSSLAVIVVLVAGPQLMQLAFGPDHTYDRLGLAIVAGGMGLYLTAATLNQAALAQGQARWAAACWAGSAALFVLWVFLPALDVFRRVQIGYAGSAAILVILLYVLYRRARARSRRELEPGSPEEVEARLAAADEAT
jgi:O-antigen/teichoic acid export membrane protein